MADYWIVKVTPQAWDSEWSGPYWLGDFAGTRNRSRAHHFASKTEAREAAQRRVDAVRGRKAIVVHVRTKPKSLEGAFSRACENLSKASTVERLEASSAEVRGLRGEAGALRAKVRWLLRDLRQVTHERDEARRDHDTMLATLTDTQARCSAQEQEIRDLKKMLAARPTSMAIALGVIRGDTVQEP